MEIPNSVRYFQRLNEMVKELAKEFESEKKGEKMPITKEVIVLYTDDGMGNSIGEIVGAVVRCKDCKWWKTLYFWEGHEHKICVRESHESLRKAEDFCSWGERKEDADAVVK